MTLLRLLLLALLVYVPNQRHFPTELGIKGLNVFNLLLIATVLLMLVLGVRSKHPTPMRWRVILFCGLLVASFLLGQLHPAAQFLDDLTALKSALTYILLYFVFFHASDEPRTTRLLLAAVLGVVFLASLETVRQGLEHGFSAYKLDHRVSGPFGYDWRNANRAGVFFATFAPLFLAAALSWRWRVTVGLAGTLAVATTTLAIFFTYSRQAYIILAVGVLAIALVRRSLALALALLVVGAGLASWAPSGVVERMEMTYEQDASGDQQLEASAESRLLIWRGAWQIIKENPIGIGFRRFPDEIGNHTRYRGRDAHNQYVLVATEDGVQTLLAFLAVLAGLFGLGRRLLRVAADEESHALAQGYLVAVVCLALGNVYGSPFFFGELTGDFWALSGLVARRAVELEECEAAEALETET